MRIKTAHIALIFSILALAVSLFTAVQVSSNSNDALISALMAQNDNLQAQIDALSGQQGQPVVPDTPSLLAASLTAAPWADGMGADVTLTLESAGDALLRVMLGSEVIAEVPCQSDGTLLTATAQVPAANGYTYTAVIGSEARTLASPDNPVYPELVYLADTLSAYCNLVVGEWYVRDNVLTLESGFATINLPLLTDGTLEYTAVRLVLKHGDTVLDETPISPAQTEEMGSFACGIDNAAFSLPALEEGQQVDLYLEATLSNGQVLTHCAASWFAMRGGFSMAAG